MNLIAVLAILTTLHTAVLASLKNETREFYLTTVLKPGQPDYKCALFDNLTLEAYHTGAGENDAVLVRNASFPAKGFLNGTVGSNATDASYHNMEFDLGNSFPYYLDMQINTNFYAAWEPVGIDVGISDAIPSGFWLNATGLQWTSIPTKPRDYPYNQFGGWLVCMWWHGVPQLFFRLKSYPANLYPAPSSCADVHLMPVYV